ncbi:MAG: methylisocitrate lyase [Planctomycetaceae bacterium]|nr:methylisocitrate lyase [Planctomycetaceae bacterium]
MNQSPGAQFRELLQQPPLAIPGVFNALVAKMAERIGFKAVYQSGAALSAGLAALPDVGLITMSEFTASARYLVEAVSVPVISDADTGFGEPLAVERCVQAYESAGLAGLHLEDQQMPKRCGHLSGKTLVGIDEMTAKLQAAASARRDPDFVIIARTDARGVNGLDDALERAKAYVDAGADVIFPEALKTPEEFQTFANEISVPLIANMTEFGQSPLLSADELAGLGFAAVLFPVTTLRSAMKAVEQMLTEIMNTGTQAGQLENMQSRKELYELLGYENFDQRDRSYFEQ